MNKFDIDALMASLHSQFPPAAERPIVGITANYADATSTLGEGYYKQIIAAGGTPLIIPPSANEAVLVNTLDHIDALLLSGGADINPLFAGEEPQPALGGINAERDLPELLVTRLAYNRQLPILGICRGIQTLAMALGGKVHQDISSRSTPGSQLVKHSQTAARQEPTHSVTIGEDTLLHRIYSAALSPTDGDTGRLLVNSFHHQAVAEAGPRFRVAARAADGIVEAIESSEHKPIVGVQWHPECLGQDGLPLFRWLVDEARTFRHVKRLHRELLTLDTHCDTPMFFGQGIQFTQRDPRLCVDLHKMTEGRLDATIMVAYLPQKEWRQEQGRWMAQQTEGEFACTPRQYADSIFSKIDDIVSHNEAHLALARTPDDLWLNKQRGRKSIMLGIENGLALEGDLSNVAHFQRRGVVYITLCHNGDNDVCDSAKGLQTHGGLSDFGKQVVLEMNRLGLMVDLSHAHERSFYDALDISRKPIVCSHSSARALCDHPRNLTDEQMRALAAKGGVCQITLYAGFLRQNASSPSEASIHDAMAHLDHAIRVMGIDHVGLGTDFDGDGGVCGLANASELTCFTRQLLARRYSEADIQKIWGGNFLRVMRSCQTGS